MNKEIHWAFAVIVTAILLPACTENMDYSARFYEEHNLAENIPSEGKHNFILNPNGNYAFKITTANRPPNPVDPEAYSFLLSYKISKGDISLREGELMNLSSPWWDADGKSGFILEWLHIPEDLPANTRLYVSYLVKADDRYISSFGDKVGVGIWKISDK